MRLSLIVSLLSVTHMDKLLTIVLLLLCSSLFCNADTFRCKRSVLPNALAANGLTSVSDGQGGAYIYKPNGNNQGGGGNGAYSHLHFTFVMDVVYKVNGELEFDLRSMTSIKYGIRIPGAGIDENGAITYRCRAATGNMVQWGQDFNQFNGLLDWAAQEANNNVYKADYLFVMTAFRSTINSLISTGMCRCAV